MPILKNFYLLCLGLMLLAFSLSIIAKKREVIRRSITLIVLLHIFCVVLWQGFYAFLALFSVLTLIAVYEISLHYPVNKMVFLAAATLYFCSLSILPQAANIMVVCFCIATFITVIASPDLAHKKWFLVVFSCGVVIPCSFFCLHIEYIDYRAIIAILLLVQFNDTMGYLAGKFFGKTKIFKTISPNKTLQGYLGSVLGVAIAIVILHTLIPILQNTALHMDVLLGSYIFIFSNAGDLVFSAVKRKLSIKDYSNILPGHGGILDRFDSIIFCCPFFSALFLDVFRFV